MSLLLNALTNFENWAKVDLNAIRAKQRFSNRFMLRQRTVLKKEVKVYYGVEITLVSHLIQIQMPMAQRVAISVTAALQTYI